MSRMARRGQIAAHPPSQVAADREAEPCPLATRPSFGGHLHEGLEHALELVRGYADPRIPDPQDDVTAIGLEVRRNADGAPGGRELDGIGEEVEHDLLELL